MSTPSVARFFSSTVVVALLLLPACKTEDTLGTRSAASSASPPSFPVPGTDYDFPEVEPEEPPLDHWIPDSHGHYSGGYAGDESGTDTDTDPAEEPTCYFAACDSSTPCCDGYSCMAMPYSPPLYACVPDLEQEPEPVECTLGQRSCGSWCCPLTASCGESEGSCEAYCPTDAPSCGNDRECCADAEICAARPDGNHGCYPPKPSTCEEGTFLCPHNTDPAKDVCCENAETCASGEGGCCPNGTFYVPGAGCWAVGADECGDGSFCPRDTECCGSNACCEIHGTYA